MQKNTLIDKYTIFKYLWIIVFFPKPIQLLIFIIISLFINIKSKNKIDIIGWLTLCYILIFIFSIYVNIHTYNYELTRIIAAMNSLGIWLISFTLYIYYKNNKVNLYLISKYSYINIKILIILSIISIILYNIVNIKYLNLINRNLYTVDWFQGEGQLRFTGFLEYSNLVIFFYLLFFPLSIKHVKMNKGKISRNIFIFTSIVPIALTLSRSGYFTIFMATFLTIIYFLRKKMNRKLFILTILTASILCIAIIYYFDITSLIFTNINELINGRPGSTSTRTYLYKESIRLTNEYSPVWGLAIKQLSITGYPLGSHSTYVGLYYKTGIIGLVIGIAILLISNIKIYMRGYNFRYYKIISIYFIMIMFMLVFEDIDGSNWTIVSYFSIMGIMLNRNNWTLEKII